MPKHVVFFKPVIFLLFTISIFLLTACKDCSKKVPCPGYEDALLDTWFPYVNNQVLVFKSNTNLYDTIVLNVADSTIAYEYSSGGYGSTNRGCNASKSFVSTKRDSSNYAAFSIILNSAQDAYSTKKKEVHLSILRINIFMARI